MGLCDGPANKFPFPSFPELDSATRLGLVGKIRGKWGRKPEFLLPSLVPFSFLLPFLLPCSFPHSPPSFPTNSDKAHYPSDVFGGRILIIFDVFASFDALISCTLRITWAFLFKTPPTVIFFLLLLSLLELDLTFPHFSLSFTFTLRLSFIHTVQVSSRRIRRHSAQTDVELLLYAVMYGIKYGYNIPWEYPFGYTELSFGSADKRRGSGTGQDLVLNKALHVSCLTQ